ncbi:putative Zn-dependent protease [Haloferula luteola]|uniref:Putative Zn-dependent protease n=1 Tax=Haloferula luteola TaxID=595692 RepID=A0A840VCC3_9BACT|nr:hypothetical protein [Haloferula luteola]MBB5351570.1 putative Zn-dependent protease [Haloferula luteola]
MKTFLRLALAAIVLAILGTGGFYLHRQSTQKAAQVARQGVVDQARKLLQTENPGEALKLLQAHFKADLAFSDMAEWPSLMVNAAAESRDYGQLESLVGRYPFTLRECESAALWWMRMKLHRGQWDTALPVLELWPPEKRQQPHAWKLLEADQCIHDGRRREARESLDTWKAEGNDEVNRQLRLALLADKDPATVTRALNAAFAENPQSVDLRATAAGYLESFGRLSDARREYIAAYLLEPSNPLHGEQLARFYLRTRALPQAIETWRQTYEKTGDVRSWFNDWFWERVTQSRGQPLAPRAGEWWGGVALDLANTPIDAFLPENFLTPNAEAPAILADNEAFQWLTILEQIRTGQEAAARATLDAIKLAPDSTARDLQTLLSALLDWRAGASWPAEFTLSTDRLNHRFFATLANLKPGQSPSLETFLRSSAAPAALILAQGWTGAADRLLAPADFPLAADLPTELDWLPYALTKMRTRQAGAEMALQVAAQYPNDLAVQGLAGELLLSLGKTDEGLAQLESVASDTQGPGTRANYLLALAELERRDWKAFDARLAARTDLADSVGGRELTARAALARKDPDTALAIYQGLGTDSIEGLVYRFREALAADQRDTARTLLQDLLRLAPNEPIFHQWLHELDRTNT